MSDTQTSLVPDHYYHIFNRAVGKERLFDIEKDYIYFLDKLHKYILPISELFSFCLMPNHFHLIIRIKCEEEIKLFMTSKGKEFQNPDGVSRPVRYKINKPLSQEFSNFFNAYSKYYNFWNNRTGTLFKRAFRRKEILNPEYLRMLICYVHQNPVKAGLANKPEEWKYSSYQTLVGTESTILQRDEIISFFGDLQNFIYCNSKQVD